MEEDHTRILRPQKGERPPPVAEAVTLPLSPERVRVEQREPAKILAKPHQTVVFDQGEEDQRTVLYRRGRSQPSVPESPSPPVSQVDQSEPVVGWLVIVKGPGRGRAFSLGYGVHFLGRGEDQRIPLPFGDLGIARQNHVAVTYDGIGRTFYVSQGESTALAYHNGKPVLQMIELAASDCIRIGETELVFTPFCGSHFDWQDA